ncbi:MAG: UDP-glucose 4-epimerase GalE [Bacilli bacterium]
MKKILITGGTGFIGSHTCVELLENDYEIIVIDNLCNSKETVVESVEKITNKKIKFYKGDVRDKEFLKNIFITEKIDAVIHFAGLKAVGESVEKPLKYYENNLYSTITLLEVMKESNCKNIIFSSSATVYGKPLSLPILEDFPLSVTNPYGATKLMIEMILKDIYTSDDEWKICILRYFNPVGSHSSGLIGEDPNDIPNNLMPIIIQVANGKKNKVDVFGGDYNTVDGTGVRDYIHIVDLAKAHVSALKNLFNQDKLKIYNVGTGVGYSVLEMIKTFEKVNNVKIPYEIVDRRLGDIGACYASTDLANKELNFKATKTLEDMCVDAYKFVLKSGEKND